MKPDEIHVYNNRGFAYAKLGQIQLAIEDFKETILLKPDDANGYHNRGLAYFLQGNNNLGCHDAQMACALGDCKLLEKSKEKGFCR